MGVRHFVKLIPYIKRVCLFFSKKKKKRFIYELVCFFSIFSNRVITASVFLHWFTFTFSPIILFIRSPISFLAGFINLHLRLLLKFPVWLFDIMNYCFWLYRSIPFSSFRSFTITFALVLIIYIIDSLF